MDKDLVKRALKEHPGDTGDTPHRRGLATFLMFWTGCSEQRCRRSRACMGDADTCFLRGWRYVPEEIKIELRARGAAHAAGKSKEEATRIAKAEIERWKDLQRQLGTGKVDAEPIDLAPLPAPGAEPIDITPEPIPDASRVGPRIRRL